MTEIADDLEAARAACGSYAESEARLLAEAASWRRVTERLETENIHLREAVKRSHQAMGSLERWLAEKDPDLVLPLALGLMLLDSRQKREAALTPTT